MDLNMLVSDFYVVTTSSRIGSRFDEFYSKSHSKYFEAISKWLRGEQLTTTHLVKSNKHPYPTCSLPTDMFYLPTVKNSVPLEFTHCRPSKSSLKTLEASGSTLGLAPSEHLRYVFCQKPIFN